MKFYVLEFGDSQDMEMAYSIECDNVEDLKQRLSMNDDATIIDHWPEEVDFTDDKIAMVIIRGEIVMPKITRTIEI